MLISALRESYLGTKRGRNSFSVLGSNANLCADLVFCHVLFFLVLAGSAETSAFSAQIPRHYAPNRLFHFSRLFLSPKLFNIEAKELKLEVNVEDQVVDSFPVSLTARTPRKFSNCSMTYSPVSNMSMSDKAGNGTSLPSWPQQLLSRWPPTTPYKFQNWRQLSKFIRPKRTSLKTLPNSMRNTFTNFKGK
jgi:hypothetical protein